MSKAEALNRPCVMKKLQRCRCGCAGRLRRNVVFVLATGRSGSTSLLWFLNALPGAYFSGENDGAGALIAQLYSSILTTERRSHLSAWSNPSALDAPRVHCSLARLLLRMIGPSETTSSASLLGFKTIRVAADKAMILADLFPCARFIVNVRADTRRQSKSSFYRLRSHAAEAAQLTNRTAALLEFARRLPPRRAYVHRTEDFTTRGMDSLLRWLGAAATPSGAGAELKFDGARHSPCPAIYDRAAKRVIPPLDPCAHCPRRGEDEGSVNAEPYRNCSVLRVPRVDGVMTLDELGRWQPGDAKHEGILRCSTKSKG